MKTSQKNVKNSGIEWIGEIPSDWKLVKVKHLFVIGRGRVIPTTELIDDGKYPVYSSQTVNDGCMGYINTYDFDGDFLTWTTDGVYAGSVFKRSGKFNCTNVCGTLKCKVIDVDIDYLWYAIDYCSNYNKRTDINGAKIMNNEMAKIVIVLPDYEYQKKVSNYLSDKCKNINRLIKIEEQQTEKLKEYKQSLITEVVTKGLDKNVEMKDSGVEWIGKIPKDWQVIKLKYAYISVEEKYNSGEYPYIALENIESKSGNYVQTETNKNYSLDGTIIADKNAVVFGKLRPYLAKAFLITKPSCVSSEFAVFVSNCNSTEYLKYLFLSNNFIDWVNSSTYGTKMPRANIDFIRNTYIALPNIKEQNNIVNYIKTKSIKIDDIINVKKAKIEKLNEYKKSLIYEYVTGKKEV